MRKKKKKLEEEKKGGECTINKREPRRYRVRKRAHRTGRSRGWFNLTPSGRQCADNLVFLIRVPTMDPTKFHHPENSPVFLSPPLIVCL